MSPRATLAGLVLVLAGGASGQEPEEAAAPEETAAPAEEEAAPPPPPRPPPAPPTPLPHAPEGTSPALLDAVARFFGALRAGDASSASSLCASPFQLEADEIRSSHELRRRLAEVLAARPLALLPLHGIEILPGPAMIAAHGPPPARLGDLDLEGAHVAIANFGGKAVVVVFRGDARGSFRAVALTE